MKMVLINKDDFAKLDKVERQKALLKIEQQQKVARSIYHDDVEFLEGYVELHNRLNESEGKDASK